MPVFKLSVVIEVRMIVIFYLLVLSIAPVSARQDKPDAVDVGANNPLALVFNACDADRDGFLTKDEYLKRGGQDAGVLVRDFKVFDFNRDDRLSLVEFLIIPVGQPEEQRGAVLDPVVLLAEQAFEKISERKWIA
jgi:hypothetical protein